MLPVLEATGASPAPSYLEVLDLDQNIRNYYIPSSLDPTIQKEPVTTHPTVTQQVAVSQARDICKY